MKLLNWYKEKNIEDVLFYTSWGLLILAVLLTTTVWWAKDILSSTNYFLLTTRLIKYFATFLSCVVILFNLIQKKYEAKAIIGYALLFAIFLVSAYFSKNTELVGYWFFFAAAYKKDAKKILEISITLTGLLLLVVVIFSQVGIVENMPFDWPIIRYGLGFNYCNHAPTLFFFFILQYVVLRKDKIKIWEFVILEAVNGYFFIMTHTQMAFYLGTLVVIFFAAQSLFKNHWKMFSKIKWLWIVLPLIIFIGTIIVHVLFSYDSTLLVWLDNLFHGRLVLGRNAIDVYGFTAFGQPITWMGFGSIQPGDIWNYYNYVDSSYLKIMLEFGIIAICAIVAIYILGIYKAEKTKNYWIVFAFLFAMLFSVTEPRLIDFAFNALPILIFTKMDYEGFVYKREKNNGKN